METKQLAHEHECPIAIHFVGLEHKVNNTCIVTAREMPGFVLVGADWDEIERKLPEAAREFLEFDGFKVERFEIQERTDKGNAYHPTGFTASFSGKRAA